MWFVKTFPDVEFDYPRYSDGKVATMWNLIPKKKIPPTRVARYCCTTLKEQSGKGRFVVTGVRRAESIKRSKRTGLEIGKGKNTKQYDPDNPDQQMIHICQSKAQRVLNPIIDWDDGDVWEFIKTYNLRYCCLYDEGFKRLGCIGCPMAGKHRNEEFKRYPKIKSMYMKAIDKMLQNRKERSNDRDWKVESWKTAEEVFEWWMSK